MNRSSRGHKSTKIPNVKLRPLPSTSAVSSSAAHNRIERDNARRQTEREDNAHYNRIRREANAAAVARGGASEYDDAALQASDFRRRAAHGSDTDDDGGPDEEDFDKPEAPPLAGIVLCFSSIEDNEDRLKYTRIATQLGARVESDFRHDVHYLICEKVGTPKYHEALENGKAIVTPSWLEEVQKRYRNDVPCEWKKMLAAHRIKPLQGLHLILTGYESGSLKLQATEKAIQLGAKVSTVIDHENQVTHMVSGTNHRSESKLVGTLLDMKESHRRGNMRTKSSIQIVENTKAVWSEWLEDCDRVRGAIRETTYNLWGPRIDVSQRMQTVQKIRDHYVSGTDHPSVAFHDRLSYQNSQWHMKSGSAARSRGGTHASNTQQGLRKPPALAAVLQQAKADSPSGLRRAVSEGAQVGASSSRNSPGPDMLGQSRAKKFSEPILPSTTNGKRKTVEDDSVRDGGDKQLQPPSKISRSASVGRSNPFARPIEGMNGDASSRSPFTQLNKVQQTNASQSDHLNQQEQPTSPRDPDFFQGVKFRIRCPDPDQAQSIREFVEGYGATVVGGNDVLTQADFTIVPLFYPFRPAPKEGTLVTRFFIEACEVYEHIVALNRSFGLVPSTVQVPIPDARNLVVFLTGFNNSPQKHLIVEAVIQQAGGRIASRIKECTHMLCHPKAKKRPATESKIEFAKKYGIHVVDFGFIEKILSTGDIDPPCPPPRLRAIQSRSNSDTSLTGPFDDDTFSCDGRSYRSNTESPTKRESPLKVGSPLQGVFITWSGEAGPNEKFQAQAQALGAVFVPLGDRQTTHLLHQGALTQRCTTGMVTAAVHLVHPDWLRACVAARSRADETMYSADLGRPAPLAEATQREGVVARDAAVREDPATAPQAATPFHSLKGSSTATTETGSTGEAAMMNFPDTCGETARVMAALNADLDPLGPSATSLLAQGAHGGASSGGRRKLRPQRALGRTTSNGSATTEVKPPEHEKGDQVEAEGAGGSDAAAPFDAAGWATQIDVISETPPMPVRVSYEDDGKRERARLLAALERGHFETGTSKSRDQSTSRGAERGDESGSGAGQAARDGSRGSSKPSGGGSKNRIQARRHPGTRY